MGVPSLVYPHGRDQGNYAYAAWEVLLGAAPYRDVFVFKPPGSVWQHAISLALFGVTPQAIRVWDLLWTGATAGAVGTLTYLLSGRKEDGVLAAVAVGVLYWSIDYWNVAQTDGWTNLPAAVGLLACVQASRTASRGVAFGWSAIAGGALAMAVVFKYTALGLMFPMSLALVLGGSSLRSGVERGLVVILAAMAATAVWVAWIVGIGAWPAFLDSQADLVPQYVVNTARTRSVEGTLKRLFWLDGAWYDVVPLWYGGLGGLLGAAYFAWRGRWADRSSVLIVAAWWTAGLAGLVAQNKFFDYHFLSLLGPSAVLLGLFAGAVYRSFTPWWPLRLAWGVALFGLVAATPVRERWLEGAPVLAGWTESSKFWSSQREFRYKDWNVDDQRALVDHLRQTTRPEDRVFVWGFEPAVNVWAQRRTVTRFLYNYPFRVGFANEAYEAELLAGLRRQPPEVFVVVRGDVTYGVTGNSLDSAAFLRKRPELVRFIDAWYGPPTEIRRYQIRRLLPPDARRSLGG
jgi:hypothetical protein